MQDQLLARASYLHFSPSQASFVTTYQEQEAEELMRDSESCYEFPQRAIVHCRVRLRQHVIACSSPLTDPSTRCIADLNKNFIGECTFPYDIVVPCSSYKLNDTDVNHLHYNPK